MCFCVCTSVHMETDLGPFSLKNYIKGVCLKEKKRFQLNVKYDAY